MIGTPGDTIVFLVYKNLYTEVDTITNTEEIEKNFFIEDHTRLAYDDTEYCEGMLTMDESRYWWIHC